MAGCGKSRHQRFPEDSRRPLDRISNGETDGRVGGRSSQSGGSFDCVRSEAACVEGTPHLILDVAMTGCGRHRGCVNDCVHESSAEEIGIGDHAVLGLVELGPSDHT